MTLREEVLWVALSRFAAEPVNTTESVGMTDEMKTFYSDYLIDNAEPKLVHDQFGQVHDIPKNGGKEIEFRKYDQLPKLMTPLEEGKTPDGQELHVSTVTSRVQQYGGYVPLTDLLILTAIDNNLVQATKLLGGQAGRTLDTVTREVLNGGTNVQYGEGAATARHQLQGGGETDNDYFTVDCVQQAARALKRMNIEPIGEYYVGIIHPDVSYDLKKDPAWVDVKTYSDPEGIYRGEIGRIEGVRFVETTEAKIFHAEDLAAGARTLTVQSAAGAVLTVAEALTAEDAAALPERLVLCGSEVRTVLSAVAGDAGAATVTLDQPFTADPTAGAILAPGEAGAGGRDVYSTLILGDNAYGVTSVTGGGLQHIVKQLGSAGADDPLNQRGTAGWKALKTAERLVEQAIVRVETCSTSQSGAN